MKCVIYHRHSFPSTSNHRVYFSRYRTVLHVPLLNYDQFREYLSKSMKKKKKKKATLDSDEEISLKCCIQAFGLREIFHLVIGRTERNCHDVKWLTSKTTSRYLSRNILVMEVIREKERKREKHSFPFDRYKKKEIFRWHLVGREVNIWLTCSKIDWLSIRISFGICK